jgi:hypothetical protein
MGYNNNVHVCFGWPDYKRSANNMHAGVFTSRSPRNTKDLFVTRQ